MVRGDIIIVSEGDRVPADGVLLSAVNLSIDESMLTGESVPVRKASSDHALDEIGRPGGDDLPFVFSGTMVVQGQGLAEIRATGAHHQNPYREHVARKMIEKAGRHPYLSCLFTSDPAKNYGDICPSL